MCTTFANNGPVWFLLAVLTVEMRFCCGQCTTNPPVGTNCGNTTRHVPNPICGGGNCVCLAGYVLQDGKCHDRDECSYEICRGKGKCVNTVGSYSCSCLRGWQGDHCVYPNPNVTDRACMPGYELPLCCRPGWTGRECRTDIDECSNSTLNNCSGIHEHCRNKRGRYDCYCDEGWEGPHCSQDVSECLSNPCKNNATCVTIDGSYTCNCSESWTGSDCNTDVNECLNNPCKNNATCINLNGSYTCQCSTNSEGRLCEILNYCKRNPCLLNETCINTVDSFFCGCKVGINVSSLGMFDAMACDFVCENGGSYVFADGITSCRCIKGWNGSMCSEDINECESRFPCEASERCTNHPGSYACICQDECVKSKQEDGDIPDGVLVGSIVGPVLGLILLWATIGLILTIHIRSNRKTGDNPNAVEEVEAGQDTKVHKQRRLNAEQLGRATSNRGRERKLT